MNNYVKSKPVGFVSDFLIVLPQEGRSMVSSFSVSFLNTLILKFLSALPSYLRLLFLPYLLSSFVLFIFFFTFRFSFRLYFFLKSLFSILYLCYFTFCFSLYAPTNSWFLIQNKLLSTDITFTYIYSTVYD